jgi:hypothetical protein
MPSVRTGVQQGCSRARRVSPAASSASWEDQARLPGNAALVPEGADQCIQPAGQGLVGEFLLAVVVGCTRQLAGGDKWGDRGSACHTVAAGCGTEDEAQPEQLILLTVEVPAWSLTLPLSAPALTRVLALLGPAPGICGVCLLAQEHRLHQPGQREASGAFRGDEAGQGLELVPVPVTLCPAIADGPRQSIKTLGIYARTLPMPHRRPHALQPVRTSTQPEAQAPPSRRRRSATSAPRWITV